jgi:peptidoglycan hydrolase CwlO-like protein
LQSCPLATVTCDVCQKTHLRQDGEAHITQNVFSHFTALAEQLKKTQSNVTSLERKNKKARNKVKELEQTAEQMKEQLEEMEEKAEEMEEQVGELEEKVEETEEKAEHMEQQAQQTEEKAARLEEEIEELKKKSVRSFCLAVRFVPLFTYSVLIFGLSVLPAALFCLVEAFYGKGQPLHSEGDLQRNQDSRSAADGEFVLGPLPPHLLALQASFHLLLGGP